MKNLFFNIKYCTSENPSSKGYFNLYLLTLVQNKTMAHNNPSQDNDIYFSNLHTSTDIQNENSSSNINYNTSYNYTNGYPMMSPTSYEDTTIFSHHDQQSMTTSSQQSIPDFNTSTQQSVPGFNTSTQQSMTDFNTTSTQQSFNISHIPQYNNQNNPMPSTNNISSNPLLNLPQSGIFRFDIPGFKIIVVPVTSIVNLNIQDVGFCLDDSSSNITNNPQTQFQQ